MANNSSRDLTQNLESWRLSDLLPTGEGADDVWFDVLSAVDRTYADLVDYQERLERQNHELEDLRSFLGSILASVSDVLIVVSRSGTVLETSASVARITGKPLWEWHTKPLAAMFTTEDVEALDRALADATNARATVTIEASLLGPDEPAPLELSISPRMDDRGRVAGYVLTGRPLGELRKAYSALAKGHEELKAAQAQLVRNEKLASLGRLLAGVAHELNNPISFVYANAHALERYASKFEAYFQKVQAGAEREELIALREELKLDREIRNLREAVHGAREGAERVRDIVEDLRRLSADGSGEMVVFDLVDVAQVAANWVIRGARKSVSVQFTGLPSLRVQGRPGHIQQIVMNLVQNAFDALEGREDARIEIGAEVVDGRGHLYVRDNGPGVPEDVAQAIFDPFFTTKPVGRGTGLGLSISHKIAEEHGGRLRLCPQESHGACFRIDLALAEGAA
ncbi:ATP-binding protein [Sinirhodobacter sp. WL0062]|uniref:histidine kinase n=1 Tax=Rhodobacter flavimaris TaxID=2907145 RepID=A0ABS8YSV6_9RHOB|nr:ATP-binding protein [Sinirhodobacter sp. WL0062]MCE5972370.1 ATP-binding protein [Sinirhodobacter sp. WL0062]